MRKNNEFVIFLSSEWFLQGFVVMFELIWKLIKAIFDFFKKLTIDIVKNVYGRVVIGLGAIVLAVLISFLFNLTK